MTSITDPTSGIGDGTAAFEAVERGAYRFSNRSSAGTTQQTAAAAPTAEPPATRRRGRLLIALLLIAAVASGVATVWDSLLRYRAYGVVTGQIVDVSVPIDGVLKYVLVREGDTVRQNDALATVCDLEIEQKLARVADELRIADATLHAEIARIQWQSHVDETEMTRAVVELFEGDSRLHEATGNLNIIRNELSRTQKLHERKAIAESEVVNQTLLEKSQQDRLEAIRESLIVLKRRADAAQQVPRLGPEQIAPLTAKCDMLLNEIDRLQEWLAQGDLRSPVNGTVLTRHRPAGECVKAGEPLFSVIEESSAEIELYVDQDMSSEFQVGSIVEVKIAPLDELVPCTVVSVGREQRKPPEHIGIFYRSDIRLLPVRLRPVAPTQEVRNLPVGAVAKLPHFSTRF
ncbi:MAG: HlyD family efflux transporter periplasmic adaptor subunit [Planctomycetaceae bacterium]